MLWNNHTGWNTILDELNDLHARLNRQRAANENLPGVRLYQNEDEVIARMEIPGVDPEGLQLTVQDDNLLIGFERQGVAEVEKLRLLRRERPRGNFSRNIPLPYRVNADAVEANFDKGILSVRLPRADEDRPRKIAVKTA